MNEYICLGVELRTDSEGRYFVVPHSREAKQALEECTKFSSVNPYNSIEVRNLWIQVIDLVSLRRNKAMLRNNGWNEYVGCFNASNMTCRECKRQGLAEREKGCIFSKEGINSYDTSRSSQTDR